mmetsp:Transcript_14354/g.34770  ORF Transcript_14354/g.34770 Transcript_14354/m.34770 type:complete len:742 (-) Transcript_14354:428-2653(-)
MSLKVKANSSPSLMSAILLLLLLQLIIIGLSEALQQPSPVLSSPFRKQICLWSSPSSSSSVEETSAVQDLTAGRDEPLQEVVAPPPSYWDEQFEELLSFKAQFGHCNFPQNAPTKLSQKYPTLARFCHEQRLDNRMLYATRLRNVKMSLVVFDRNVRCRKLKDIGFEFDQQLASWYDKYHELIQYQSDNGHVRVRESENSSLCYWITKQRSKRRESKGYASISEDHIKLLDKIGFEWESEVYDAKWMARYNELVDFRNKHGHIQMVGPLNKCMHQQRARRRKGNQASSRLLLPLTDEQIALLDDIEFPWDPERYETRWHAQYNELVQFQQKHGHCKPECSTSLFRWVSNQRRKRNKGTLSKTQINLLDKIDFPWEARSKKWPKMYQELTDYLKQHNHLRVTEEDDPALYDWMANQRQKYHGMVKKPVLTDDQIERLEQVSFCWSLDWRDRTWHEYYMEAAEFFKQHDHVRVTKKDNPGLYNWISTQEKRYKEIKGQKPLSDEETEMLEQLDFEFFKDQPTRRMAWNAMYAEVKSYRKQNNGNFPTRHKDDPKLNRWIRQQRNRMRCAYGHGPLSDEQKALLESIDFPMPANGSQIRVWYEMYDELVAFWKEHGHFLVSESYNLKLSKWITTQRGRYHGSVLNHRLLSQTERYLLERIGFPWASDRVEVEWQMRFDELVQFQEKHGHLQVSRPENKSLNKWMIYQRQRHKGNGFSELPQHQIQQLDKIGFSWLEKETETATY